MRKHDWSWRAQLHFQLSNIVEGQILGKILTYHEACFKKGKTAHLHTFFKIRAGGTAQLFDPNSEHEFFTDIYS